MISLLLSSLLLQRLPEARSATAPITEHVCDPLADYYLGMEDYPEAIRRHQQIIMQHPDNALAHYHLGFAEGLIGQHTQELGEYQAAVRLGLSDWDLFLNLGLLYLETNQPETAINVLELATLLAPEHAETHYNLAIAYERTGKLRQAEQEILLSLSLDPSQIDARNQLGVIYAEEGNYARARDEWQELAESAPDYSPARANLTLLRQAEQGRAFSARENSESFTRMP